MKEDCHVAEEQVQRLAMTTTREVFFPIEQQ